MREEAMKLALEALESLKVTVSNRTEANVIDGVDLFPTQMAALQKALANEALGKMAENARELGLDYEPAQKPQRWAEFCQGCRKEWSVSYPHPGKDICVDCDDKPAQVGLDYEPAQPYKVIGTQPTGNICFFGTHADNSTEVLRLSKEGIWANPDVPADEAAKLVLVAMDFNIKVLVDKAVADEREQIIDLVAMYGGPVDLEAAIRARSNT